MLMYFIWKPTEVLLHISAINISTIYRHGGIIKYTLN